MGKLSNAQEAYIEWYKNGKKISTTRCYPGERYSGKRNCDWYVRFVNALKLEHVLPVPVAVRG